MYVLLLAMTLVGQQTDNVPGEFPENVAIFVTMWPNGRPPFTLPLPATAPFLINQEGNDERDENGFSTVDSGIIMVDDSAIGLIGIEAEHTDNPPMVLRPIIPGSYDGDYVYFPPTPEYPTGCIKVPDGSQVLVERKPDGKIVVYEIVGVDLFLEIIWRPVDDYGWPYLTPGWVKPENHNQPANGFMPWSNPDEDDGIGD